VPFHLEPLIIQFARGLVSGVKRAVAKEAGFNATFDSGDVSTRVPRDGEIPGESLQKMHGRRTTIGKTGPVDHATHPVTKRGFEAVIPISLTDASGTRKGSVLPSQHFAGEVIPTAGKTSAILNGRNRFNVLRGHASRKHREKLGVPRVGIRPIMGWAPGQAGRAA
jgi:hypothetical protein